MEKTQKRKKHFSSFQIIVISFALAILAGALLLMLPIASKSGVATPFNHTLFTSTSAVCVTGLVVRDTATHWSIFGQAVILIMIQIGGMGIITVAAAFAMVSGRKISLMQRSTMQEAFAAPKVGGIVRLSGLVIRGTLIMEFIGAIAMAPSFCRDFGLAGIWKSVFHAVSAFCNAGFDILGSDNSEYLSLTRYAADPVINIVIMLLIVTGGIGFLTWDDIKTCGINFKKYRMQSKVILVTTGVLIIIPAVFFFFFEFAEMTTSKRVLCSFFQAITPRTAGFNTADLTAVSGAGRSIMIALMIIGGSPGSTAGGMKTTTIAVLVANAIAVFRRKESPRFFGRSIENKVIRAASTIFTMYISLMLIGAVIISIAEDLPMGTCMFETASAVGTVGLTLGITPGLGVVSQIVLILLMFFGRVGGMTLIFAAISSGKIIPSKLPNEKITVG